ENYNRQLQALQDEYAAKFKKAPRKDFVTGHAAFAYLCRDFGLTQQSVESVFSSGEPSARQLARLADYCRAHNVKTIFVEDMVSP
ncbi:zinc ABC transporter substrate-binding protein, partial [Phascolarctobacterium faecium]